MKNGWKKCLASIGMCFALSGICVGLQLLGKTSVSEASAQKQPMEKDAYNGAGLAQGQALSGKIIYDGSKVICYEDRVLHKFTYKTKHAQETVRQVKRLLTACPGLTNVYVLPVPPRICSEPGFDEEKYAYTKFVKKITEGLPEGATYVDALQNLEEHSAEYVFFRTEDSWTARGAYYGMEVLAGAMGRKAIPLDRYEEFMYNSFGGSAKYLEDVRAVEEFSFPVDLTYYYLLPQSVNRAEITRLDEAGNRYSFKKPLITISARNDGTFVDAAFVRAVVDGESNDAAGQGKSVLVICDEKGKLLVPYLKDYYDCVYVVNVREDDRFAQDVNDIVAKYHITEAVYVQNACDIGVDGYDKAWQGFAGEENENKITN